MVRQRTGSMVASVAMRTGCTGRDGDCRRPVVRSDADWPNRRVLPRLAQFSRPTSAPAPREVLLLGLRDGVLFDLAMAAYGKPVRGGGCLGCCRARQWVVART